VRPSVKTPATGLSNTEAVQDGKRIIRTAKLKLCSSAQTSQLGAREPASHRQCLPLGLRGYRPAAHGLLDSGQFLQPDERPQFEWLACVGSNGFGGKGSHSE